MFQMHAFTCFSGVFHMLHMYVSYVNAQIWKNDAYAHVMQVQLCKANTWSVTLRPRLITELSKKSS
jgi:hypothetical protein